VGQWLALLQAELKCHLCLLRSVSSSVDTDFDDALVFGLGGEDDLGGEAVVGECEDVGFSL